MSLSPAKADLGEMNLYLFDPLHNTPAVRVSKFQASLGVLSFTCSFLYQSFRRLSDVGKLEALGWDRCIGQWAPTTNYQGSQHAMAIV